MSRRRRRNHSIQIQLVLAAIVTLQGEGRWKTREPKYRQLDSWLESLIEREVNCSQSWICTRCTFLHRRASWRGNMHRGFLGGFLSSDFFLPALSEWWPTQSTSSLNFSKAWINFEISDLLLHGEYRACLISCKLTLDLTIARLWRKLHFFGADEVAFPCCWCWWPEMQVCQIEIGGLQTLCLWPPWQEEILWFELFRNWFM